MRTAITLPLSLIAVIGFLFAAGSLMVTIKDLWTSDVFTIGLMGMQTLIAAAVSKGLWILARHLDTDHDRRTTR
jgi:hypothetical protein